MTYYIGTLPVSPYLEHHGILGMKWGVRRYQNEDGTLTEAGKARYGVIDRFKDWRNRNIEINERYQKAIKKKKNLNDWGTYQRINRRENGLEGYKGSNRVKFLRSMVYKRLGGRAAARFLTGMLINSAGLQNTPVEKVADILTRNKSFVADALDSIAETMATTPIDMLYDEYKIEKATGISRKKIAEEYDAEMASKRKNS